MPYGRVCRVCLCIKDNLHNLNEINEEYCLSINDMLYKTFASIHQHKEEFPLPQNMCNGCVDQLQSAYRFQEICLATHEQLYKIWKESKKETNAAIEVEEEMNNDDDLDPIKLEQNMVIATDAKGDEYLVEENGEVNRTSHEARVQYNGLEKVKRSSSDEDEDENLPLSSLRKNQNPLNEDYSPSSRRISQQRNGRNDEKDADSKTSSNHCSLCNKYFKYAHHLAKHQCKLTAKQAHTCEMCSKQFSTSNMLQKHKRNKHKEDRTPAKANIKKINKPESKHTTDEYMEAQQNVTEMTVIRDSDYSLFGHDEDGESDDADYTTADQQSIKAVKTPPLTAINDYSCTECNACFRFEKQLERHLKKHTEAYRFVCPVCSDRFKYPFMLQKHTEKHHPDENSETPKGSTEAENKKENLEKSHICKYCPSAYTKVGGLAQHMSKKHPEIVPFKCDKCDKTFVVEEHLKIHTNRHMGIKNFKCELCDKSFSFKFAMKQHMRIHTGDLNYLCTLCGKKFYRPSNLRQHMQRHGDDKPYTCPHCPKRFKCPSDRYIHLMSHQEGKNHVCSTCGSRFSRVDTLQQHQILHTGQKPYKCDQCPMAFPRLMNLNRHLRTHTGEKPYKCKYCDKAYAQSNDLNKHLRSHVGENTYMCSQCPAAFKYQADLRNHEWEHYRKQKEEEQEQNRTTKSEVTMNEIELMDGVQ